MATQIVIGNGSYIKVDDSFHIDWADKGNAMPALPDTIHAVIWNNLPGQNEIQNKDASTGNMTNNTDLNATSDAVGSTTIAALLTWAETRKGQIIDAQTAYDNAVADDAANGTSNALANWMAYDSNYS
tara:strand:+ start:977 stop:1360 length:384 start_codon:yes stop_codon:yes gene_type:complete